MGSLSQIVQYDLAPDYFDTYAETLRSVSVEDAKQAASKVIFPNSLVWVIVGDRSVIQKKLDNLGYGQATLIDSEGNLL